MAYRVRARDEEAAWTALAVEANAAALAQGRVVRKRVRIVWACAALVSAALGLAMLQDVRVDDAHRTREGGVDMCGPGLVTCPEGETCAYDDYSFVLPVGHCEQPCRSEHQTCSRTRAPRECMYTEADDGLRCVRVYGFSYR